MTVKKEEITQTYVKQLFHYDPDTGLFTRKISVLGRNGKVGNVVGSVNDRGYIVIGINGEHYRAHRLAWLYTVGTWPSAQIDHINGDRVDNRFSNLREATQLENNWNSLRTPPSGFKGVSFHKHSKKWTVFIKVNGKNMNLGYFDDPQEASDFYQGAAQILQGDFAHHISQKGGV